MASQQTRFSHSNVLTQLDTDLVSKTYVIYCIPGKQGQPRFHGCAQDSDVNTDGGSVTSELVCAADPTAPGFAARALSQIPLRDRCKSPATSWT